MTGIHPITRQRARKLRTEMTPQERRLWAKLRELNRKLGLHFRRQAPIGPFIADFADLGRRLVIEIDGGGHGGERDQRRDEWLASQGFQVLRFWNAEVSGNIDGVMQVIFDAVDGESLADRVPPSPSPSPRGGGEALGAGVARHDSMSSPLADAPAPRPSPTLGEGDLGQALRGTVDRGASPPPGGEGLGVGGAPPEGSAP
ncbi:MAG: endonuclease domain-containing protein [Pseudomonadota bacterium]